MEKLQERLQQLELQRAQLSRDFDIVTGAALEIQRQIQELIKEEDKLMNESAGSAGFPIPYVDCLFFLVKESIRPLNCNNRDQERGYPYNSTYLIISFSSNSR